MPRLFSYGTLQQEDVQLATFGRRLDGHRDTLPKFAASSVPIPDEGIMASTGRTHYANVIFNDRSDSQVTGTVFDVTDAELAAADEYERSASYVRIVVGLTSGTTAWVYVHAPAVNPSAHGPG